MRPADEQVLNLLLRDGDGKPQNVFSNLEKTQDGKLSFIVGRHDTGEYYRHTIETVSVGEEELKDASGAAALPDGTIDFYSNCGHQGTVGEIGNRRFCNDCRARVDEEFAEFWEPIIFPNGKLDIEELKGNLLDFSTLIENAKSVYMHITGGNIGKLNTDADAVIGEADRQVQKRIDDAVEEALEECSDISAGSPSLQIVIDHPGA